MARPRLGRPHLGTCASRSRSGSLNRHGLIAGATGTGKTKTIQLLAGELSKTGVPVFVTDIKGDVTGLGAPGDATNPRVIECCQQLSWTFAPSQTPTDIPASVLAQLGNRFQHALRAFTPQDADNIKKTVQTFPMTSFFDVGQEIQQLGTGEALVTVLSPNGVPTPLAPTRIGPPDSPMAALDPATFQQLVATGSLSAKYSATIDRQSAHEIITARIQAAQAAAAQAAAPVASAGGGGFAPGGGAPTATPGQVTMTQAEYNRQARDQERAAAAAQKAADQAQRAQQRAQAQAAAAQKREETQMLRTGTRLVTSSVGQSLIRGVFGTLFGKH